MMTRAWYGFYETTSCARIERQPNMLAFGDSQVPRLRRHRYITCPLPIGICEQPISPEDRLERMPTVESRILAPALFL